MPQVPFFALHDWRAAFERLGVTIDRDAYEQINLIEQDAAKQASDASFRSGFASAIRGGVQACSLRGATSEAARRSMPLLQRG